MHVARRKRRPSPRRSRSTFAAASRRARPSCSVRSTSSRPTITRNSVGASEGARRHADLGGGISAPRRPDAPPVSTLRQLIEDGRAALVGPIRQELLSGIRDQGQFERLKDRLSAFPDERIERQDYERAAKYFNVCRGRGIQGSNTDSCCAPWRVGMRCRSSLPTVILRATRKSWTFRCSRADVRPPHIIRACAPADC